LGTDQQPPRILVFSDITPRPSSVHHTSLDPGRELTEMKLGGLGLGLARVATPPSTVHRAKRV